MKSDRPSRYRFEVDDRENPCTVETEIALDERKRDSHTGLVIHYCIKPVLVIQISLPERSQGNISSNGNQGGIEAQCKLPRMQIRHVKHVNADRERPCHHRVVVRDPAGSVSVHDDYGRLESDHMNQCSRVAISTCIVYDGQFDSEVSRIRVGVVRGRRAAACHAAVTKVPRPQNDRSIRIKTRNTVKENILAHQWIRWREAKYRYRRYVGCATGHNTHERMTGLIIEYEITESISGRARRSQTILNSDRDIEPARDPKIMHYTRASNTQILGSITKVPEITSRV